MELKTVYVSVGTTKFDALIQKITSDEALKVLKSRGCEKLILQIGRGATVDAEKVASIYNIEVEQYDFKCERTDFIDADLIVGHAGAGTCMDILNHQKSGLIVINEELMSNHQMELAYQLAKEKYIYYCNVGQLVKKLGTLDFKNLKLYEQTPNMDKFVESLNNLMSA